MRFRATLTYWLDVDSLETVDAAVLAAQEAALGALGAAAIEDPDAEPGRRGASGRYEYEPLDDAARAALDAEDLGHGIGGGYLGGCFDAD